MREGQVENRTSIVSSRSRVHFAVRLYTRSWRGSMALSGNRTYIYYNKLRSDVLTNQPLVKMEGHLTLIPRFQGDIMLL